MFITPKCNNNCQSGLIGHLNYRLRVLLSGLINFLNMSAQNRQKCINPKRHNIILLLYCKIELK